MNQITKDLMQKTADDVTRVAGQAADLCGDSYAIAIAAAAASIGMVCAELANKLDLPPGTKPDAALIMMAALVVARNGAGIPNPLSIAKIDLIVLKQAGRI